MKKDSKFFLKGDRTIFFLVDAKLDVLHHPLILDTADSFQEFQATRFFSDASFAGEK